MFKNVFHIFFVRQAYLSTQRRKRKLLFHELNPKIPERLAVRSRATGGRTTLHARAGRYAPIVLGVAEQAGHNARIGRCAPTAEQA